MTITVRDNREEHRYEARDGDEVVAFAAYKVTEDRIALTHTETTPAFRGRGVARTLVDHALSDARERGLSVLPFCPYVRKVIAENPGEHLDLVREKDRERFRLRARPAPKSGARNAETGDPEPEPNAPALTSARLTMRPWTMGDVDAALAIYGDPEVARWLAPAMDVVPTREAMRIALQQWTAEQSRMPVPTGRWAIEADAGERVVGGITLLYLPPGGHDLELGWVLNRDAWGNGYAAEAAHTVAQWAFQQPGVSELFAVARVANARGTATAERIGMEWVGETDKYYDLLLQVYRVRAADLGRPLPGQPGHSPG